MLEALSSVITQANDGKTIVFTVRGNYANAKISGLLKYVAPPVTAITGMTQAGQPANTAVLAEDSPVTVTGTLLKLNLDEGSADTIGIKLTNDDGSEVLDRGILNDKLTENTETQLKLSGFTTLGAATHEEWLAGTGRTYLFLYKNGTQHDFPITLVGE